MPRAVLAAILAERYTVTASLKTIPRDTLHLRKCTSTTRKKRPISVQQVFQRLIARSSLSFQPSYRTITRLYVWIRLLGNE